MRNRLLVAGSAAVFTVAALAGCTTTTPAPSAENAPTDTIQTGQYVDVEGLDTDGYSLPSFVGNHAVTGAAFVRLDPKEDALFGYELEESEDGFLCAYPNLGLESADALPADGSVVGYEVRDDDGWVRFYGADEVLACVDDPDEVEGLSSELVSDAEKLRARGAVVNAVEIEVAPELVSPSSFNGEA